jgi:MFS family permease
MSSTAGFGNILAALRQRNYRIFMLGNVGNHMGMWTLRMTAGWLAWELTKSATWLGLVGFADLAPIMIVGPLSGALVDRVDRLTILRLSQIVIALLTILIFLLVQFELMTVELLFGLLLLAGVFLSISQPARTSLIPGLVQPQSLLAAISFNALVSNGGRLVGPMVGGIIIVQWGIGAAFAFCAASFVYFAATLWAVHSRPVDYKNKQKTGIMADVVEGATYAARHPGLGPLMMAMTVTALVGRSFSTLFPGFAAAIFDRGADALAMLTATLGAGALIGGVYLARRGGVVGLTRVFVINIAVLGFGLIAFAATDIYPLAIVIVAGMGSCLLINSTAAQTLMQHAVDEDKRGRISGLYGFIQRGGQSIGALVLGISGDLIGLRETVIAAGILCLCFWLWSLRRSHTMAMALEG